MILLFLLLLFLPPSMIRGNSAHCSQYEPWTLQCHYKFKHPTVNVGPSSGCKGNLKLQPEILNMIRIRMPDHRCQPLMSSCLCPSSDQVCSASLLLQHHTCYETRFTKLHFGDPQSDHSIEILKGREGFSYCHSKIMDTVLTTRLCMSTSSNLPLHPYTSRGSTAQGALTLSFTLTEC